MFSYIYNSINYYLGYKEDITPHPTTLKFRGELLKQIRLSQLKLRPVFKIQPPVQTKPVCFKNKNKKTYASVLIKV